MYTTASGACTGAFGRPDPTPHSGVIDRCDGLSPPTCDLVSVRGPRRSVEVRATYVPDHRPFSGSPAGPIVGGRAPPFVRPVAAEPPPPPATVSPVGGPRRLREVEFDNARMSSTMNGRQLVS